MNIGLQCKISAMAVALMGILGVSICISEALARNCIRVVLFLVLLSCVLHPNLLKRLVRVKLVLCSMLVFFSVMLISAIYGGQFSEVVHENLFWLQYTALIMPACVLILDQKKNTYMLLYLTYLSVLIADFYVFYQTANGVFRPYLLIAPSVMGSTCIYATLIPAMVASIFDENASYRGRIFSAVCALFSMAGLICSNTRGGWLAVFPLVFVIMLWYLKSWRKRVVAVVGCIFVAVSILAVSPSVYTRANSIVHGNKQQSVTERFIMWETATKIGIDHPVIGVGKGNYSHVYNDIYKPADAKESPSHAHSNLFMMLGEDGFLGLLSYCFVTLSCLVFGWKYRKNIFGMIIVVSTLGFSFYSLTDYTLASYESVRVFWFLMGICASNVLLDNAI